MYLNERSVFQHFKQLHVFFYKICIPMKPIVSEIQIKYILWNLNII